jgi:hydrogenase expression/formation protein HypC
MCIGVPMKVLGCTGGTATAVGRGGQARLDAMLLGELRPGSWVLAFRGVAVRTLSDEEAAQTDAALDALAAVLAGDGASIDAHFRDLVEREPQLPAHLRGARA